MKYLIAAFFFTTFLWAQDPCEYSTNVTDTLGTYKNTKNYLVYERNFAGTMSQMYFSLASTNGLPTLNIQFIQKSKDFLKAYCLDKNSRIFLQLDNGKIVTLLHIDQMNCGVSLRTDDGFNNRVLSGFFMFTRDSYDDLKTSPVSMMRLRSSTETIDYIFRSEIASELDGKTYRPSNYFIETLRCIEN
jgi:hypothetical protein